MCSVYVTGQLHFYVGLTPVWVEEVKEDIDSIKRFIKQEAAKEDSERCSAPVDPEAKITEELGVCPYYLDEKVLCYAITMQKSGRSYKSVCNPIYGEFLLIPDHEVTDLQNYQMPEGAVRVTKAVRYFLNCELKLRDIEVEDLGNKGQVWILPSYVADQYHAWYQSCASD